MPELPEVEYTARQLRASVVGKTIADVSVFWDRTIGHPDRADFLAEIVEREIVAVRRRGKYLLLDLSGNMFLTIHRRMSGNLFLLPLGWKIDTSLQKKDEAVWNTKGPTFRMEPTSYAQLSPNDRELLPKIEGATRYCRVCFNFTDGYRLLYTDPRKFGRIELWSSEQEAEAFKELGPEPLSEEFTLEVFRRAISGRKNAMKQVLLAQEVVAGLGNIYADEALFYASIHPLRHPASLTEHEVQLLHEGIVAVLKLGVEHGGTSFNDYRDLWGEAGENYNHVRVYQQNGKPCVRCGTVIERIVIGQRAAHFCPCCQKPCVLSTVE
ncbi:MAG: bifunctional DNA-formamidopyrimidine glycosylase/DNA-(apurinic or apyrimidinic site) lyase [Chloroflexota bacterium]|nr:bifunctional DNA-formamidopyrimidine glycosylase/DNA-(apurinic or apyrimidinic site) lyase [Chloroflexota bacterium]